MRGDELVDGVGQGDAGVGVGQAVMQKRHHDLHSAEREQFSVLEVDLRRNAECVVELSGTVVERTLG